MKTEMYVVDGEYRLKFDLNGKTYIFYYDESPVLIELRENGERLNPELAEQESWAIASKLFEGEITWKN
jgi:hypothetical protein